MDATATLLQTSSPARVTDFSLVPSRSGCTLEERSTMNIPYRMYTSIKVYSTVIGVTFVVSLALYSRLISGVSCLFDGKMRKQNTSGGYRKLIRSRAAERLTSVPGTMLREHVTSCEVSSAIEAKSSTLTVPIRLRLLERPKSYTDRRRMRRASSS